MERKSIRALLVFISFVVAFAIAGAIYLANTTLTDSVKELNSLSRSWLDPIFSFLTDFGLGGLWVIVGVILLFYRLDYSLMLLSSLGLVALVTNLCKQILFPRLPRPLLILGYCDLTRWVNGADTYLHYSFPSGHTMTVFAVCALFSYWVARKSWSVFFFVFALLVGISRVYMLQHFFRDVYFGALSGTVIAIVMIWVFRDLIPLKMSTCLRYSIITVWKRNFSVKH